MLHQIPDTGRETVVVAIVKTALSLIERKFITATMKTIYAIIKVHPWAAILAQFSLFLK